MLRTALVIVLVLIGPPVIAYQPAELLRPGVIHGVAISPSGRYVAVGIGNSVGITEAVAILDLERDASDRTVRRIPLATPEAERVVTGLAWASDAYLLLWMNQVYKEPKPGKDTTAPLYSIDAGGAGAIKPYNALPRPVRLAGDARPDSRYVYLISGLSFPGLWGPRPYEVELATGSARLLAEPDPVTMSWRLRDGRAVLKFNEGKQGEMANIYASLSEGDDWTYVNSLRFPEDRRNHLEVIGQGESPFDEYLRKTPEGSDVDGIYLRDLSTKQITAKVFELPGHDVLSAEFRRGQFLSATYVDDTLQLRFADQEFDKHYAGLRKYFGADTSIRVIFSSTLAGRWLLFVSGPRNPGEYHVYDPEHRHVELIGAERPWLEAARLAPSNPLVITTRDGAQLRAYLTCPSDGPPERKPLVVLPPDGPWDFAYLRYSAYAQAFAAEGWCTVEANVRGTYGRGRAFQALGFGQWNARVADDVADVVQALVKDGVADPARVAGFGGLLGGTALMAAEVRQPGLFRAIAAYAPVLDGESVLRGRKNLFGRSSLAYEDWSRWLGALGEGPDLRKQLVQVRAPLFLIHPTVGSDTPIEDTRAFEKALTKSGRPPLTRYTGRGGAVPYSEQEPARQLAAILDFLRPQLGP